MSKKLIYNSIRNICCPLVSVLGLVCYPSLADAQTRLEVHIGSGSDDLRSGNSAFINLVLVNGEVLTERFIIGGLDSFKSATRSITFSRTVNETQIRSIRIRHDGNPRPGNPFDDYDTWDLRKLRVRLTDASFVPVSRLYDSARDSSVGGVVRRFNSRLRQIDIPIRAIGTEPDFVVTNIIRLPRGLGVVVLNQGLGTGRLTSITCSTFGRSIVRSTSNVLNPGQSTPVISLGFVPSGTVTCSPSGVDTAGNPEVVTANNNVSRSF